MARKRRVIGIHMGLKSRPREDMLGFQVPNSRRALERLADLILASPLRFALLAFVWKRRRWRLSVRVGSSS